MRNGRSAPWTVNSPGREVVWHVAAPLQGRRCSSFTFHGRPAEERSLVPMPLKFLSSKLAIRIAVVVLNEIAEVLVTKAKGKR
jgi:hypothetical protein